MQSKNASVAIILGYFNGQTHIDDQLKSIFNQSHQDFHIFLYDDQSQLPFDLKKIKNSSKDAAKISVHLRSKNVGFTNNFLNALADLNDDFEYFAFSDQDDVWYPSKLETAIEMLSEAPKEIPALYFARTEITDMNCVKTLGYSPLFDKPLSFANALIENIAAGNTMVFNKTAKQLIVASSLNNIVVSHDWWCYQIVTGAGGLALYDPKPCLKYRQHDRNIVGAKSSWKSNLTRLYSLFQGRSRRWNDTNTEALLKHKDLLTTDSINILDYFVKARQSYLFKRILLFKHSGIYSQILFKNLALLIAVLFKKI